MKDWAMTELVVDKGHTEAAAMEGYAVSLYNLFSSIAAIGDSVMNMLLSNSLTNKVSKAIRIAQTVLPLLDLVQKEGWVNPAICDLAVNRNGHFVTCDDKTMWDKYPNYAWGCYTNFDKVWAEGEMGYEPCYFKLLSVMSKLNMPNYMLWAYVYAAIGEEEAIDNLADSLLAYVTEDDRDSDQPNSSQPSNQQWALVRRFVPEGDLLPAMCVKVRETHWDVLADKGQVGNLQLYIGYRLQG